MNPNLTTSYTAFTLEHDLRVAQAEHGWQAEQAAGTRARQMATRVVNRRVGIILVAVGERLQGVTPILNVPAR